MNPITSNMRLLASIVLVSVLLFGLLGAASPAAAAIESADRTIGTNEAAPGENVTVEVVVRVNEPGDRMSTDEFFKQSFDAAQITSVTYNGERISPFVSFADREDGIGIALEPDSGFEPGDVVTVRYEVTIPEDAADGETYRIEGESAIDDNDPVRHEGDTEIIIAASDDGSTSDDSSTDSSTSSTDSSTETPTDTTTAPETATETQENEDQTTSESTATETATASPQSSPTDEHTEPSTSSDDSTADETSETPTATESTDGDGTGFGSMVALLAMIAVVGALRKKRG